MLKSPRDRNAVQPSTERRVAMLVFLLGLSLFAAALASKWLDQPVLLQVWVGTLITTPILAGWLIRRPDFGTSLFVATAYVLGDLTAIWAITLTIDVDPSSAVEAFTAILWTAAAPFAILVFAFVIFLTSRWRRRLER
jgi:hypothetical protein